MSHGDQETGRPQGAKAQRKSLDQLADLQVAMDTLIREVRRPGLAAQARIHAELQDLQSVVQALQERVSGLSSAEKSEAAEVLQQCKEDLQRANEAFGVVGRLLDEHAQLQAPRDYGAAAGLSGRASGGVSKPTGSVEIEG